ncbi:MAG: hypothetical protein KIH08_16550 [Candidatus Freyarchaeota archaeon]|nr:hypothetical protein [Candidatus Jordarchaeia archaeon]MBS7270725.1 hypothetical protein [Candidatus Jordarchaeia archaeon]
MSAMESLKIIRFQSIKNGSIRWLHIGNILLMSSSLAGLIIAYSAMNSLAVTALGLVFIASLSLEVLRSNFKVNPGKEDATRTQEIKQRTSGRKRR